MYHFTKNQLFRYFSGEASLEEKTSLKDWLSQKENQEFYFQYLEEYEREKAVFQADENQALADIRRKINEPQPEERQPKQWLGWVAASVGIVFLAGVLFQDSIRYQTFKTGYGTLQELSLEDGTKVKLNANSLLKVPRFGFGKNTREVVLEGQAYFSVQHTPTHQKFIVHTESNHDVEVLGTEFDVRNRGKDFRVVLDKGSVRVHYGDSEKNILMKPGDKVTSNTRQPTPRKEKAIKPQQYSAWRSHTLVFENTTLLEVGDMLRDNYGLEVEIPSGTKSRTITGEITAKNIDEVVEALSEVFGLSISRTGNTLTFF